MSQNARQTLRYMRLSDDVSADAFAYWLDHGLSTRAAKALAYARICNMTELVWLGSDVQFQRHIGAKTLQEISALTSGVDLREPEWVDRLRAELSDPRWMVSINPGDREASVVWRERQ